MDTRNKNTNWNCTSERSDGSKYTSNDDAQLAVLMDIRDELQELNRTFNCQNFRAMPRQLEKTRAAIEGLRRDLKGKGIKP